MNRALSALHYFMRPGIGMRLSNGSLVLISLAYHHTFMWRSTMYLITLVITVIQMLIKPVSFPRDGFQTTISFVKL